MSFRVRVPLLGAVLLLLGAAVTVALVPAGVDLDRRVTEELRRVAVSDLGRAPMILADRNASHSEALSMHAMSVAMTEGLVSAVQQSRLDQAAALARETAGMYGEDPVLLSPDGEPVVGPPPDPTGMEALRRDGAWTGYVYHSGVPRAVGLVSLAAEEGWQGAAGSTTAFDSTLATTLAGLARADVTVLGADGAVVATTLDSLVVRLLVAGLPDARVAPESDRVRVVSAGPADHWVSSGDLDGAGSILFSRSIDVELLALPGVRSNYAFAGLLTLLLALGVGAVVATLMLRPVRALAVAAERVSTGDFEAPVPDSRVEEVHRLGSSFRSMRDALRRRLAELGEANDELEKRQERLASLQAELIRQDRLQSSARMVAELAHEIRNPVANVRNCLEVVRRSLPDGSESVRFADMAIDELLRMHELAEHLLDLNRPSDATVGDCAVVEVAEQVADLATVGEHAVEVRVSSTDGAGESPRAEIPPDVLKQVLFNLVQNAAEAGASRVDVTVRADGSSAIAIDVEDDGNGIDAESLPHIFDPFFTTKGAVTGVGLGLFVADGLVRRHRGNIEAGNRPDGGGARFTLVVPRPEAST